MLPSYCIKSTFLRVDKALYVTITKLAKEYTPQKCSFRFNSSISKDGRDDDLAGQRGGAAVPMTPWPSATFPTSTAEPVQLQMVQHLEKLSLVDVANEEGLSRLNYTIRMAEALQNVDVEGVAPLYSVLEHCSLYLDDDVATTDVDADTLLACAAHTQEEFFVVPPGNIDYVPDDSYYKNLIKNPDDMSK